MLASCSFIIISLLIMSHMAYANIPFFQQMPYTVNQFLSQVSLGLLNGCSFHRNAGHVVQGGPVSNHLNPGTNPNKGFKDAGLESVIFQEYSADFPHKKYTLGYAGRPGGPDFYVSTVGKHWATDIFST
jgi:cyclophilin family peptidyl-prolyl cis-trans isomerase